MRLYEILSQSLERHLDVALVTITQISFDKSDPENMLGLSLDSIGQKMLVWSDGRTYSENETVMEVLSPLKKPTIDLIQKRTSKTLIVDIGNQKIECFVQVLASPIHLIVAGAGHIAKPIVQMGKILNMKVTVICDRQQFANREHFPWADKIFCQPYLDFFRQLEVDHNTFLILVTRGHQYDVMILKEILKNHSLRHTFPYIGMIGSKRRISGVFSQLHQEFPKQTFSNIFAPIGLDLGAETPEEIALSVLAEVLKVKNGATGKSLKDKVSFFLKEEE